MFDRDCTACVHEHLSLTILVLATHPPGLVQCCHLSAFIALLPCGMGKCQALQQRTGTDPGHDRERVLLQMHAVQVQNGQLRGLQEQGMQVQGVAGQPEGIQGLIKVIVQMQQQLQQRLTASTNAGGAMQQNLQLNPP